MDFQTETQEKVQNVHRFSFLMQQISKVTSWFQQLHLANSAKDSISVRIVVQLSGLPFCSCVFARQIVVGGGERVCFGIYAFVTGLIRDDQWVCGNVEFEQAARN